jgi:hypothetical protein
MQISGDGRLAEVGAWREFLVSEDDLEAARDPLAAPPALE